MGIEILICVGFEHLDCVIFENPENVDDHVPVAQSATKQTHMLSFCSFTKTQQHLTKNEHETFMLEMTFGEDYLNETFMMEIDF